MYRYRYASNLLIIEKYPEWVQLALRCDWTVDIRVTGQAITTIQGLGRKNFRIERGMVCASANLYQETGCIPVITQEGLSLKVCPDELWDEVVASFLPKPHTGG